MLSATPDTPNPSGLLVLVQCLSSAHEASRLAVVRGTKASRELSAYARPGRPQWKALIRLSIWPTAVDAGAHPGYNLSGGERTASRGCGLMAPRR